HRRLPAGGPHRRCRRRGRRRGGHRPGRRRRVGPAPLRQAEHPGRFLVVDVDDEENCAAVLAGLLSADEPQAAVRDGALRVPRLVAAPDPTRRRRRWTRRARCWSPAAPVPSAR
ncbi:hypothetical protein V2I01_43335, partial [Micromonospora sp. BRA006-A]|nr:hypothetical protein [Micromonospora sp. BRA006-A]